MNYIYIDTQSQLDQYIESALSASVVAIDTEFVRTRTYYAQLGLVQIFDGKQLALVDTVAIHDSSSLATLLAAPNVLKVLHACSEDIEVFQNDYGVMPTPMIDTQHMAAFLGEGISMGFAAAVSKYLGVELDKSESRADWTARPLSQKQLNYAAADVHYLLPLYHKLVDALSATPWTEAAKQEALLLAKKRSATRSDDVAYLDIKGAWQLNPSQLMTLKLLAKWRKQTGLKRNLALNFVFKEADLLTVAMHQLTSFAAMEKQDIDQRSLQRYAKVIGQLVSESLQIPEAQHPERVERLMDKPGYKALFKQLKDAVKDAANKSQLPPEMIASKKQINQLINWHWKHNKDVNKTPDVMQYWRKSLIGDTLDKMMSNA
ncbi:ribonuclease D [Vibrio ulleungensis]|uniref:Ribonuclease D n=1 Tax=Vibrio ulleungensis TaxID=2807619 RepID=A0ABS2HG92_9VIBR|nr:ribonuclease D [Vibrio ulleungensis]MBM7036555.1 ribonuclease D [Vibrio ulleungensis]